MIVHVLVDANVMEQVHQDNDRVEVNIIKVPPDPTHSLQQILKILVVPNLV